MFYLQKIQKCKNYKNYDIQISVSLFKNKESYRGFHKYTEYFMKWFKTLPSNFYVRMYVDLSVLDDKNFIKIFDKGYENLEVILFEYEKFLFGEQHDGTFGSMARFLSLCNLPEIPENVKWVWISDLDLPGYLINNQYIKFLNKNQADISYHSKSCYNEPWINSEVEYPIVNSRVIVSHKFIKENSNMIYSEINNFLNKILDGQYDEFKNYLIQYLQTYKRNKYKEFQPKYFPYGFDELFTNNILYPYFEKYKTLVYLDLSLIGFNNYIPLRQKEQLKSLIDDSFKSNKNNTYKNKLQLKKLNDEIYEQIKDINIENQRMNICRIQYNKYKSNFIINEMGFVGLIIRK